MSNLLQAELLKLRTTRTFLALAGAAVAVSLLLSVLVSALSSDISEQDARDIVTFDFTGLFILVLGAIGMTGEWRHRTITSAFLAAPDRARFLIAKLLAYAAAGAVMSLVVSVAVMIVSMVILSSQGEPTISFSDALDVLWRNLLIAALFGALGVAVGAVLRTQVLAIVGLLLALFIVEPTLAAVAPDVARFGPLLGAPASLYPDTFVGGDDEVLSPVLGVLVELAWIASLSALGALLLNKRDLT